MKNGDNSLLQVFM